LAARITLVPGALDKPLETHNSESTRTTFTPEPERCSKARDESEMVRAGEAKACPVASLAKQPGDWKFRVQTA